MERMNNVEKILATCVVALTVIVALIGLRPTTMSPDKSVGSDIFAPTPYIAAATSGQFTLTSTSQTIVATNTSRAYLAIRAQACGNGASIEMDKGKPATIGNGFTLSTTTGELSIVYLTGQNLYRGAVTGITSGAATCQVSVYER